MKLHPDYFNNFLYPLQNKVLDAIEIANTTFYLTGGTALSRGYYNHRYSDDLDFFLNNSNTFDAQLEKISSSLSQYDLSIKVKTESYARGFITLDEVILKLDFVNDVPFRRGEIACLPLFYRTDNPLNILSNKITALNRDEPKDVADILFVCNNLKFNWKDIIADAKNKDASVDEIEIANYLNDFNIEMLNDVNWINAYDLAKAKDEMFIIQKEVLMGLDNSLFK